MEKIYEIHKKFFEQFIILIQFMTRIPIPIKVNYSEKNSESQSNFSL